MGLLTLEFEKRQHSSKPTSDKSLVLHDSDGLGLSFVVHFFNQDKLFVLVKGLEDLHLSEKQEGEVISVAIKILAATLSWEFNVYIKFKSKLKGNPKNLKFSRKNDAVTNRLEKLLVLVMDNEECLNLLSAYNKAKKETKLPLRFLMYYRLLEVLSRKKRIKRAEDFIVSVKPWTPKARGKRNSKNLISTTTMARNRIHATDDKYRFPTKVFRKGAKEIEFILRKAIKEKLSTM